MTQRKYLKNVGPARSKRNSPPTPRDPLDSEESLRSLADGIPIALYFIGRDHRVIHWNKAMAAVTGILAKDMVGTTDQWRAVYDAPRPCLSDLLMDGDLDEMARRYAHNGLQPGVIPGSYEARGFYKPPGNPKGYWLHFTAATICDIRGQVIGAVQTIEDVTEHRRLREKAEQAEREMRERLKKLECLRLMAEAEEECGDDLDAFLAEVARILPTAFLDPGGASALIIFRGRHFQSDNYRPPRVSLDGTIKAAGEEAGTVEVSYSAVQPLIDDGPFLAEERKLIDGVCLRLGRAAERVVARRLVAMERSAIEQKNIALRELMARIQDEKTILRRQVSINVETVILPILDSLARGLPASQTEQISLLRKAIDDIASPFAQRLSLQFSSLTPAELRICAMIKQGRGSKEIAEAEHISPDTVRSHRFSIRRKLGLLNKAVNLASYLQKRPADQDNETKL